MSEVDLSTPIQSPPSTEVQITPEEVLASVQEARSCRALTALQRRFIDLGLIDVPTEEAIEQRRKKVRRLMTKTRKVAWIWANVYGYGDDDLFPSPLYDQDAAYLAVVQAGVILVLDEERRRVACFVSDDGCSWERYSIRRNTALNTSFIFTCRIKCFPRTRS
jgi:hypothetical protein